MPYTTVKTDHRVYAGRDGGPVGHVIGATEKPKTKTQCIKTDYLRVAIRQAPATLFVNITILFSIQLLLFSTHPVTLKNKIKKTFLFQILSRQGFSMTGPSISHPASDTT